MSCFCPGDQAAFAERPFPLAALLAEDVSAIATSLGRLARGRHPEALLNSLVSLLLWHRSTILLLERFVYFCPDEGDGGVSRASSEAAFSANSRPKGQDSGGSIGILSALIPATLNNASDLLAEVCAYSEFILQHQQISPGVSATYL